MINILSTVIQLGPVEITRKLGWRLSRWFNSVCYRHFIGLKSKINVVQRDQVWLHHPKQLFLARKEPLKGINCRHSLFSEGQVAKIMDDGTKVLAGKIYIHGQGVVNLRFSVMDWYDYDVIHARPINRHDFVPILVRAYVVSGQDNYSKKLSDLFNYWTNNFSINRLLKNDKPIDVAIRLLNWVWAFNFLGGELNTDSRKLEKIIYCQVEYIRAKLSPGGNHLLLEILAIYVYGTLFDNTSYGKEWSDFAKPIFFNEMKRQVAADGVHSEQSTFYHHVVSTHFLKGYLVALNNGHKIPESFSVYFKCMLEYIHQSMKPDLTHPMLGDGDLMLSEDREHWEVKVLLTARSILFNEPFCSSFNDVINDASYWFFGESLSNLPVTDEIPGSMVYEETGLAILRDAEHYVLFNAAPFGNSAYPHHGHADALSVELCLAGQSILIDPGGYAYINDAMRTYFRSTWAHNTIVVDGNNQSDIFGVFGYGKLAQTKLTMFSLSDHVDVVEGLHYGYWPVIHKRKLIFRKGDAAHVIIIDYIDGSGVHEIEGLLHLSPNYRMDSSLKRILSSDENCHVDIWCFSSAKLQLEVRKGLAGSMPEGWVCFETGRPIESEVLALKAEGDLPASIITVFAPHSNNAKCQYIEDNNKLMITTKTTDTYFLDSLDSCTLSQQELS